MSGSAKRIFSACLAMSVVYSSDAPGRRLHDGDEVALVLVGHERRRHRLEEPRRRRAGRPAKSTSISVLRRAAPAEAAHVGVGAAVDDAVHRGEEPAVGVALACRAAAPTSAGVSVTALKTESTTAKAMVSENCW